LRVPTNRVTELRRAEERVGKTIRNVPTLKRQMVGRQAVNA
jgi:hypothetical protein